MEAAPIVWWEEPVLSFGTRQIVDGEIREQQVNNYTWGTAPSFLDKLGRGIGGAVRILSSLLLGLLIVVSAVFIYMTFRDFTTHAPLATRKEEYEKSVLSWLEARPEFDEPSRRLFMDIAEKPSHLGCVKLLESDSISSTQLKDFPRCPDEPMFSTGKTRLLGILIGAVILLAFTLTAIELLASV